MRHAVIIEAVRTPIGRAHPEKGIFRDVRADDLSADLMKALVERVGLPASHVEDVHWGCVKQQGEQGYDIARMAALIAGLPIEVGGATVNRLCGSSLEALSALKPAFMPEGGTVTAGNSSPLNVGAAALLVMSEEKAKQLGLKPKVRVRAMAVAGVDPSVMGLGPVPATHKALERAGLKLDDIDLIELNEAFAAQALAVMKLLKANPDKVNVHGGAIAIGHPLGASGARLATTLIHAMEAQNAKFGLA